MNLFGKAVLPRPRFAMLRNETINKGHNTGAKNPSFLNLNFCIS